MFINPKTAIEEGWITWSPIIKDITKYVQPNAIDFDCFRVYQLDKTDNAFLSERGKKIRGSSELPLTEASDGELYWHMSDGNCYDFASNFHVTLPEGVAAMLIIRSTLNRSGVFLTSGLYDSGYDGGVAGMLRISGGDFSLAPNTRIGQIMFVRSEDSGILYAGGYNHAQGTHWSSVTQPN